MPSIVEGASKQTCSNNAISKPHVMERIMHHRLKALERRLARLAAIVRSWTEAAEEEQELREARQVFAGLIREGLRRAGIDPEAASILRRLDAPDPPPLPRVKLRPADPRKAFLADMQKLAERMRGRPPNLADASAMQLFAYYCVGEGAVREAPA